MYSVFLYLWDRDTFLNGRTPFLRWLTGIIFFGKNIVRSFGLICGDIWFIHRTHNCFGIYVGIVFGYLTYTVLIYPLPILKYGLAI